MRADIVNFFQELMNKPYESNQVEFKKCKISCPKLYDTLSSFSNQSSGGHIFLGVDEHAGFKITGVDNINICIKQVQDQCAEMEPVVHAEIEPFEYQGYNIIYVHVLGLPSIQRPCYLRKDGVFAGSYIRVGEADMHMSEIEVHEYMNFRHLITDDDKPLGNIEDFDDIALQKFILQIAETKPNLYALGKEKILQSLGVIKNNSPTLAGQLMFGVYPQEYLPCSVIYATRSQGNEYAALADNGRRFVDNLRVDGNLPQMIESAINFVYRNTRRATVVDPVTVQRRDRSEYPEIAVRELLLNALVHRDYSDYTMGEAISLNIFDNRLEIISPGGIFGGYTLQEAETRKYRSIRNLHLVALAETAGILENRGTGILIATKAMQAMNLPDPVFEIDHNHFKVTLYNSQTNLSSSNTTIFSSIDK